MTTTDLGKWMITNGGNYNPEAVYEQLTMVMYDNSTYITLKTVTGVTPSNDGINYILMAQGFNATALSAVTAVDTSGLLGSAGETISAQSLIDYLADAVSTKLLKKSDIATTLSSSDITVPASSLLKTTDDKIGDTSNLPVSTNNVVEAITQLNSNLATAIYSTDLMSAYDNPTFVRWDENTANTPYKAGLTMNQVGFAFCHGRYSGWQTIVAFSEGSKETFFHYCISGVPSNWLTIFSISKNTLADALHTGNNAGIYKVDSSTLNNPSITYGMEIILKDTSSQWIFTIIIPTNLSAIYFDFYNGYGGSPGWTGWRKCDLVGVS